MIVERVPTSLRNALSRWLIEPSTGVFIGNPSARVRDELWEKALTTAPEGTALQIWSAKTTQGFSYRQYNTKDREFVDLEGLSLIRVLSKASRQSHKE